MNHVGQSELSEVRAGEIKLKARLSCVTPFAPSNESAGIDAAASLASLLRRRASVSDASGELGRK